MRKAVLIFFFALLNLSPLAIHSFGGGMAGGEAVTVQKIEPFSYFCLHYKGPFSKLPEVIGQLMHEANLQNVYPTGPLMGVYFGSPEQATNEELDWEIGFPMTPQSLVQPPLEKKEFNYDQVVSAVHTGSYASIGETITMMLEWMEANGYAPAGPVLERYMDMNPQELKPEAMTTEIWIPCQKKSP